MPTATGPPNQLTQQRNCEMTDNTTPSPGELWQLTWDGATLGNIIVAAVYDDFVLGWPTTAADEACAPALLLTDGGTKTGLAAWPTLETGLGMHLLARRLGAPLTPQQIQTIGWAAADPQDVPLPAASACEPDETRRRLAMLIDTYEHACFIDPFDPEARYLDMEALRKAGVAAGHLTTALGLKPPQLRALVDARVPLNDTQIDAIAQATQMSAASFTQSDPYADIVRELRSPVHKAQLAAAAASGGISESVVYQAARSDFALAARDDQKLDPTRRLGDAITRAADKARNGQLG